MPYKFEIYKDKAGAFRVRFRAPNGEKMFATEGYTSKASAKGVIKSIIKHAGKAAIDDQSLATTAAPKAKSKAKTKSKSKTKSKAKTTKKAAPKKMTATKAKKAKAKRKSVPKTRAVAPMPDMPPSLFGNTL